MMKSKLKILGIIVTIALSISSTLALAPQPKLVNSTDHGLQSGLTPMYDFNTLGRNVAPLDLQSFANLYQPTYLPVGTSLPQAKLSDDNSIAALVYTNMNLKRINGYVQNVQIVILAQKDGTSFETYRMNETKPKVTIIEKGTEYTMDVPLHVSSLNRVRLISIAGNPGIGYDPVNTADWQDKGRVQWWSGGIHYMIL